MQKFYEQNRPGPCDYYNTNQVELSSVSKINFQAPKSHSI